MKKKSSFLLHITFFLFCIMLSVLIVSHFISGRNLHISYASNPGPESAQILDNPYCGFYQMNGYTLSDEQTASDAAKWYKKNCASNPYPLLLLEINLKNYAETRISSAALKQLRTLLEACSSGKKQVILRFLYDWEGQALTSEPTAFYRIKNHIQQVASVVNDYSDCVYILQGTLTGNNGEMNNSNYNDINQIRQIAETLDKCISPDIFLAVRTPGQLRGILRTKKPLSSSNAYDGSLESRLGLFNDGMLGSVYDLGTYGDKPLKSSNALDAKGTRSEELLYQYKLCQYVPNGGEVTVDNVYNDLENAIEDLAQMHVSYLNSEHDAAVLNKWKNSTCSGDDVFSGSTGYDYISAHLGYRYVMKESSLDFHSFADDAAILYINIENTGFSSSYRKFDTKLIITDLDSGEKTELETDIDNRKIASNDCSSFQIRLDIRSWEKGTYSIALCMKDPYTGNSIHFANSGSEEEDTVPVAALTIG
ncbi:MAG: DUF4832 domain-containing protein [Lachnospiraceae bacterium]